MCSDSGLQVYVDKLLSPVITNEDTGRLGGWLLQIGFCKQVNFNLVFEVGNTGEIMYAF